MTATVLVGMSVREVQARDRLRELAAAVDGSVAFLQVGDPSLSRELDRLADGGHDRVVLVGVSLGTLAPANSWLRRIASHWWRERGGARPEVLVATGLLDAGDDAEVLRTLLARPRALTGTEAPLTSAAWEDVPGHRHQVLVCRGPRCTARDADLTAEALSRAIQVAGLGDDDVLVTQTGCQFPCNQAPVVSVQPDDVWYGGIGPDRARELVAEHLVAGRPVATYRLPRERGPARAGADILPPPSTLPTEQRE